MPLIVDFSSATEPCRRAAYSVLNRANVLREIGSRRAPASLPRFVRRGRVSDAENRRSSHAALSLVVLPDTRPVPTTRGNPMNQSVLLPIASLLSILFFTLHLTGDIMRGFERGGLANLPVFPTVVLWLYGTLLLAERRSGYIITLLGSLLGSGIPILHMMGKGLGYQAETDGAFFFIWTVLALGVTSLFSVILSVRGLWRLRPGQLQQSRSAK